MPVRGLDAARSRVARVNAVRIVASPGFARSLRPWNSAQCSRFCVRGPPFVRLASQNRDTRSILRAAAQA